MDNATFSTVIVLIIFLTISVFLSSVIKIINNFKKLHAMELNPWLDQGFFKNKKEEIVKENKKLGLTSLFFIFLITTHIVTAFNVFSLSNILIGTTNSIGILSIVIGLVLTGFPLFIFYKLTPIGFKKIKEIKIPEEKKFFSITKKILLYIGLFSIIISCVLLFIFFGYNLTNLGIELLEKAPEHIKMLLK